MIWLLLFLIAYGLLGALFTRWFVDGSSYAAAASYVRALVGVFIWLAVARRYSNMTMINATWNGLDLAAWTVGLYFLFPHQITAWQWTGLILILAGIIMVILPPANES